MAGVHVGSVHFVHRTSPPFVRKCRMLPSGNVCACGAQKLCRTVCARATFPRLLPTVLGAWHHAVTPARLLNSAQHLVDTGDCYLIATNQETIAAAFGSFLFRTA